MNALYPALSACLSDKKLRCEGAYESGLYDVAAAALAGVGRLLREALREYEGLNEEEKVRKGNQEGVSKNGTPFKHHKRC